MPTPKLTAVLSDRLPMIADREPFGASPPAPEDFETFVAFAEPPPASSAPQARVDTMPAALTFPVDGRAWIHERYLGDDAPDIPYAFPGHGDVGGLPPVRILLADDDDLTPSGEEFARQIAAAGGEVEVEEIVGVPHGHLNFPGLAEALTSIAGVADFLERSAKISGS